MNQSINQSNILIMFFDLVHNNISKSAMITACSNHGLSGIVSD